MAPEEVSTQSIYRGAWPFIGVQLVVLLLILCFPSLVNGLPSLLKV